MSDITEAVELLEKISPWPWYSDCFNVSSNQIEYWIAHTGNSGKPNLSSQHEIDADFIAQSPEIIKSLLEELDKHRWRKVEDGLPELETMVLVWQTDARNSEGNMHSISWFDKGGFDEDCYTWDKVTHWRPLPDPPK